MKTTIAILALLVSSGVPVAQSRIAPTDVPVLLDLIVENIGGELRRQDAEAAATGIFVDAASLPALQQAVPGLTALPARGRGYTTRSGSEVTRGALLKLALIYPGENPGEHMVRVDPTFQGRRGHTVIFAVTKDGSQWKVIEILVLVE